MSNITEPATVTEAQRLAVREKYGVSRAERTKAGNTSLTILKRFAFYGLLIFAVCALFVFLASGLAQLVWIYLAGAAATFAFTGLFSYLIANAIITGLKQSPVPEEPQTA